MTSLRGVQAWRARVEADGKKQDDRIGKERGRKAEEEERRGEEEGEKEARVN